MRGITRVQIGQMEKASRYYYSLPLLPSRLKELCLILVHEDDIIGAVESQTELRSLTIKRSTLNKYAALIAPIRNSRFESKPQEKWSNLESHIPLNVDMTTTSLCSRDSKECRGTTSRLNNRLAVDE